MKFFYIFLIFLFTSVTNAFSQSDCSTATVVCGNTTAFNPSGVGTKLEQLACGGIEHNSVWVAFQAKANGKLNFVIRPTTLAGLPLVVDVDWSLYQLTGAPSVANCNSKTQLSCNFAGSSTVFGIPGATGMATPPYTAGQFNPGIDVTNGTWYVLIVDQFSNTTPVLINVQFTGNPESAALNSTPAIFDSKPDFSITTTNGCSGAYSFTNSSVVTAGIASYSWNFGDGSTANTANPSHTYITPGTYYVTLTTTDINGCQSSIRKTIIFNNTPPTVNAAGVFATPACTNANNGTITVTTIGATTPGVIGGTPPYTYELVSPSPDIRASQASNVFTGLQPGGYFVKVTDACGKSAISTVITIAQIATNSTIGLGIQNIQSACNGTPSGTATIFANGSVPPYTMALVNSSPVTTGALPALQRDPITATYYTTFINLLPGSYTVEATDACGKIRRATFTVNISTAPIANAVASPSCAGTATGTITVTATAGSGLSSTGAPGIFQYSLIAPSPIIRPFQNSSVFENLFPGTYTIAVRDICGNIGTSTVTVGTSTAPNFGTSFTTPSCPNGSTGTIEVQLGSNAGGGSPYIFELINPSPTTRPAQNSSIFTGLPPGTYTVRLTDVCGTPAITTLTVNAAAAPSFTNALASSCSTPASGTITIIPGAASIGNYSFELISPGAAIRAPQGSNIANTFNSIFTGLNQGNYTIRMTDGCNVPVTGTVTIAAPTVLAFPAGSVAISSCATPSTGRIIVAQPTTGLGAYKYELIAPSPVIRAQQYSNIFDGLPTGSYTIRITDSCGTQVNNSATPLTLAAATAPTLTVTNTSSCATASGTITCTAATANQGGGTYQFALIAPSPVIRPNQASQLFTGLPAGAYTVQITDQCGQTGTVTTTIAAAGAFTPAAGGSIVACNGSGYYGQIIVTNPQNFTTGGPIPTGSGGGPYTYAVYDATNTTLIAGPQASNVFSTITPLAGSPTHTIRVTDVCGNTSTTAFTINSPAPITAATITAATASCGASNTGVIRITTQSVGGLPPYRYTLIDATTLVTVAGLQSSTTFNGIPANATGYLVRTTDACGNTVTSATALLFPAAVTPTATVAVTASCASPSSGVITVTPGTGATLAGGTFTYALYDATNTIQIRAIQASPVFTAVAAGTYTVRIIDRCGTIGTVTATIASGVAAPTATGTVTNTCPSSNTGSIRGASTGGSLPVTYTLLSQPGGTVLAGPQADSVFSNLGVGTYAIRVTDACGTTTNSADISLTASATLPTISTSVALDCAGSAVIGGFGGGGNGGSYTYAICNGAGCTTFGVFSATSTFTVNTSGTYRVAVRDRCGNQTLSADIVVTLPSKPIISSVAKTNTCGTTTITPVFSGVPNTPYYSVDGANFSPTLGSYTPGCHTLRVADFNAGTFSCASDVFQFSVFDAPTITPATPANWGVVSCGTFVTPSLVANTGNIGCVGSGASFGIKLTSCTGCSPGADPVGTINNPGVAFNLYGATAATFQPVILSGGLEICVGTSVSANFTAPPFNCTILPVGLLTFTGEKMGVNNKLRWSTSTETNCFGYEIQRSIDGVNYTAIGFVNSLAVGGNSTSRMNYIYIDNNTYAIGKNLYYKLRQVDIDGRSRVSNVVLLSDNASTTFAINNIFPNPANSIINVTFEMQLNDRVNLIVTDVLGKILSNKVVTATSGKNLVPVNVSSFAKGTYFLKIVSESNKQTLTSKFIKL